MAPEHKPRFAIIGGGMAGILAAVKIREAGYDFTIFEKADGFGGTWRENTYPGVACDVPSHLYSYSFELNPDWKYLSSSGSDILQYFNGVAERQQLAESTRFGQPVVRCEWLDDQWELEDGAGFVARYDWVIAATGILHRPKLPDIDGLDDFEGASFHSSQWDHSVPLDGQRIGVIGTGSSGTQITGAVAPRSGSFSLFQRTAQWVLPVDQIEYSQEERDEFRAHPEKLQALHDEMDEWFHSWFGEEVLDPESKVFGDMQNNCNLKLDIAITDPVLREKLRPDYKLACKRLVISHNFYDSIQVPQAELVTEDITRIEAKGVRTADGRLHELDVLVLATGFDVGAFVRPMNVIGQNGVALDDAWSERPAAYLSVGVPNFPNFYFLNGPNSPVGNFSLILTAEMECSYILQLVENAQESGHRWVCVTKEAATRFEEERSAAGENTIWTTGCKSWYLDDRGIPILWTFPFSRFREEMAEPEMPDYALG